MLKGKYLHCLIGKSSGKSQKLFCIYEVTQSLPMKVVVKFQKMPQAKSEGSDRKGKSVKKSRGPTLGLPTLESKLLKRYKKLTLKYCHLRKCSIFSKIKEEDLSICEMKSISFQRAKQKLCNPYCLMLSL